MSRHTRQRAAASAPQRDPRPAARAAAEPAGRVRAQLLADQTVEATCLAAAALLPLYFSLLTSTVWETDKAVVLTSLAIVAGGSWLAGSLLRGAQVVPGPRREPLLWLGLLAFLAYGLSTLFSISPVESLFGSLSRHAGLIERAAYFVFFLCVATRFRRRAQIERLITVILFTSIPAVGYGIIQQFGFDPIPSIGDAATIQWPVRSTFGQHVFFGAYLVIVIPLTAARLLQGWGGRSLPAIRGAGDESLLAIVLLLTALTFLPIIALAEHTPTVSALFPAIVGGYALLGLALHELPDTLGARTVRTWSYAILLGLQILVLVFTSARGPLLGFVASVVLFILLSTWWLRLFFAAWSVLGASLVIGLFVVVLNIPGGPLQPLRTVHGFNRLAHIQDFGGGQSSTEGRLQVWQGVKTLLTQHPGIGNTWGGVGRDIVGYGPDTLNTAFEAVFPLKLRQETAEMYTVDRAHSVYLDTLVSAGILGFLALLAAVAYFFWRMLRFLRNSERSTGWLAVGLIAAVGGHLVEGVTGLETAVTLLFFWMILGLAVPLPAAAESDGERDAGGSRALVSAGWFWLVVIVTLLILLAIPGLLDHPRVLAALIFIGLLGAVAGISRAIIPPHPLGVRGVAKPGRQRGAASRKARITGAILLLTTLAALWTQWEFETAAVADIAASTSFIHGQTQNGLSGVQLAARDAYFEPTYWEHLGTAEVSLSRIANRFGQSGYPTTASEAAIIDPATLTALSRAEAYGLGIASLRRAVALAPLDPGTYEVLGDAFGSSNHQAQAFIAYQQAAKLSKDNPRYLDLEATARLGARQPTDALKRAQAALRLDGRYWYSHYILALIYHQLGQSSEARREASLGLFWEPLAQQPPPAGQIARLRQLSRTG